MKTVKFQMDALTCPSCIKKIEGALNRQKGVQEAKVLFHSSKVKVVYDEAVVSADKLQGIITKLGYPVLSKKIA
ncbi:heavy-metal-associated domain-containing protein [Siminovitchia fortis]|uniref:Copper chaperone n=1 Tax=Siminovitchia fortis TaxID=254758 RepID=A0A443ILW5_9BACI|nr:heavy-metal-associated domain-containing protein [Siminovitchia fortis]RWR06245.1 copper chaperone [Siminovitchia fortis]WHY81077.1 heavy-metal-associated domain-containing protein [Siminovitchia fortis]